MVHEGDYLKVGLVKLKNELTALKRLRVKGDLAPTMEDTLFRVTNELLVETEVPLSEMLGIGIGLPATYDMEQEKILMAPLIGISGELEIGPFLWKIKSYYHKPVGTPLSDIWIDAPKASASTERSIMLTAVPESTWSAMAFMPLAWSSALSISSRTVMPIRLADGNESTGIAFLRGASRSWSSQSFAFIIASLL